jgi:hypothetical protein
MGASRDSWAGLMPALCKGSITGNASAAATATVAEQMREARTTAAATISGPRFQARRGGVTRNASPWSTKAQKDASNVSRLQSAEAIQPRCSSAAVSGAYSSIATTRLPRLRRSRTRRIRSADAERFDRSGSVLTCLKPPLSFSPLAARSGSSVPSLIKVPDI